MWPHLEDLVPYGVHRVALVPQLAASFLHDGHDDGGQPVLVVVVRLRDGHPELGVGPEGSWGKGHQVNTPRDDRGTQKGGNRH